MVLLHPPVVAGNDLVNEPQFKAWIGAIDTNHDGRISKEELKKALRAAGMHLKWFWIWRVMLSADLNKNGVIDGEDEFQKLLDFVVKNCPGIVRVTN